MSPGAIVVLLLSVVSAPDAAITAIGPLSRNFDYPHPVKFLELEDQRQELRLAYLDVAPARPSGQVALLLHGKNSSAAYWAPTIAALTARGFRVVAPDAVGFGKSSKPAAYQQSLAGRAPAPGAGLPRLQQGAAGVPDGQCAGRGCGPAVAPRAGAGLESSGEAGATASSAGRSIPSVQLGGSLAGKESSSTLSTAIFMATMWVRSASAPAPAGWPLGVCRRRVQLGHQLGAGHVAKGVAHQRLHHGPVGTGVQHHPHPAAGAHVGAGERSDRDRRRSGRPGGPAAGAARPPDGRRHGGGRPAWRRPCPCRRTRWARRATASRWPRGTPGRSFANGR